jgi:hypothetical protein
MVATTVAAQSDDDELSKLRELLNVPSSTSITPSTSSLPPNSPIRVFIAVGPNEKIQKEFTKGINDWNRNNAQKYGAVELVSQLSAADIILARYEVERKDVPRPSPSWPLVATSSHLYLIARKSDKLEMLWRRVIDGYSDPNSNWSGVGEALRREFFNRLKARNKSK